MKQLLILFLALTGLIKIACAQQVQGLVVDKATGDPLPGATISLKGIHRHTTSGLNGKFSINLPAGSYSITVFYVGYKNYDSTITCGEKGNVVSIFLEQKKNQLAEITVSGKHDRGSDAAALLASRKTDLVQNAVSARSIEISPDLSVANVTQRVSGVSLERSTNGEGQYVIIRGMDKRYIYTLVNGIKIPTPDNKNRYVPLDIFPADLLDRLEVTKSLSPNMEGDAIGGSINMVMKDAPEKFSVKANAAAGYADKFFSQDYNTFSYKASETRSPRYTNGATYQATMNDFPNSAFTYTSRHNPIASVFGLSLGGRVLHDKLGILVAGSYQDNYRNVNTTFFGTDTYSNGDATVTSIQSRQYSIEQQRSGIHTRLDYHIDPNNRINVYAGYMNLVKNEYRAVSDTNLQLGRVGIGTGRISNSYRTLHDVQQIANVTVSGEHVLTRNLLISWTAAWSKAIGNRPDEATLNLVTGVSKDASGNLVQAPLNLDGSSSREFTRSSDEDKNGYLNITYKTDIGNIHATWMAGGMYRNKTRSSWYDEYTLQPNPGIQVYDGNINHNTFTVFNGEGTSDNALNYDARENVGAAYGMVKADYEQLQLTAGARYENTQLTWGSNVPESVKGKTGSISYYDVLPSAQLKYNLGHRQAIRLAYYSAISRPNFYEVIPHTNGNPDADYIEIGNPNLKRTTADNFDLRYEYFPHGVDQILAGVFYKRLKNPIEYSLKDSGTYTYYLPDNFGTATNYGFELDVTKYMRWFGVKANYTFTDSKITTTKAKRSNNSGQITDVPVDQTRPMQGQSKHIVNLSLLIRDDNKLGINAQLAFTYTSKRIATVSQYLDNDIWQKGFSQMDFSIEKRVARHWFIYAKVNNILNTPYELEIRHAYTAGGVSGDVPYQQLGKNVFVRKDIYGANYLLGVKFKM